MSYRQKGFSGEGPFCQAAAMVPALARCYLLAELLSADGSIDPRERALLEKTMAEAGLDEETRDRVRHFEGGDGAIDVLADLSEAERREVIDWLAVAALADGRLSPSEIVTIKRFAEALGLG